MIINHSYRERHDNWQNCEVGVRWEIAQCQNCTNRLHLDSALITGSSQNSLPNDNEISSRRSTPQYFIRCSIQFVAYWISSRVSHYLHIKHDCKKYIWMTYHLSIHLVEAFEADNFLWHKEVLEMVNAQELNFEFWQSWVGIHHDHPTPWRQGIFYQVDFVV